MAKKNAIDEQIDETDGVNSFQFVDKEDDDSQEERTPAYRIYTETKIVVSKKAGSLWKSRNQIGIAKHKENSWDAWDEAIRYYKNDQTGKRNREDPDRPNNRASKELTGSSEFAQTENIVFANVSALVPSIYAKNPDVTVFSTKGDDDAGFAVTAQKLIRSLMQKRSSPGLNLKPKARRAIVMTTLTNISYLEVGYVRREDSSGPVIEEVQRIAKEYAEATDKKKLEELEGQLAALDEKADLLQPSGPYSVFRHPKDVVIDPDAVLSDLSDAKWIMIKEVYDTSFLNAVYREKDKETGDYKSLYEPSHVAKTSANNSNMAGHDDDITNFSILKDADKSYRDYGFESEDAFKRAQRTYCWKVWDKTTRRVFLFSDKDWKWPIWVWDDPYGLPDFFPISPLAFHTDPEDMHARGEVSYYLDQQDEINVINSSISKMRHRVANTLVYNKRILANQLGNAENMLLGLLKPNSGNGLVGVDLPEGAKLSEMISAPPTPAAEFQVLFDKRNSYDAIDRVSGVPSVVKGVEYKTNTTNKAIESYESSSATRLDEKIDAIEECIGRVGAMTLHMCLQFMGAEEVIGLIGAANAEGWPKQTMSPQEANSSFNLVVTGGSSLKPTSRIRKEQAKETAQILGQFGAGSPAIIMVILKMFQRAFSDELVLEQSDWKMVMEGIQGAMQQQQQAAAGPPQQSGQPSPEQQGGGGPDIGAIVGKLGEMFASMPDEMRQKVGDDIAAGVPLVEILGKLQQTAKEAQAAPQ